VSDRMAGDGPDNPQLVNLVEPLPVQRINGMDIDMVKLAEAADRVGAGKMDVLSVDGYRDSKGRWVPNYDTVRIERKADDEDAPEDV
jgi:hypothetical protein